MRKLSLTLLLATVSFMAVEAKNVSTHHGKTIDLRRWDKHQKRPDSIPINAIIEDNNIEVQFFKALNQPVTFIIQDRYGNIVFQDTVIPNEQEFYKIRLKDVKANQYELCYLDEDIELIGEFQIEE